MFRFTIGDILRATTTIAVAVGYTMRVFAARMTYVEGWFWAAGLLTCGVLTFAGVQFKPLRNKMKGAVLGMVAGTLFVIILVAIAVARFGPQ